ncbi:response regulator [Marinicauda salina]|uniref:Response regulator n=1 Tax=Marinicauda salina TaxID=2135793 RepID=A0A2U2BTT2_9PROT|nr:response regulator [Marinicauda salina]PWE17409.1 response regulator [Marinicauda salina]
MTDRSPRVLVVDDDDANRQLAVWALEAACEVAEHAGGEGAAERIVESRPDAVLLDLRMPKVNGLDVVRELADRAPDLLPRVVVITAETSQPAVDEIAAAPVAGVFPRPWEPDEFLDLVRRCCGR